MDENPKPLSGNRTKKAKISDVVVRSLDASNLSDSNSAAENVNKHFPESEETVKGHTNHQRQDVRSAKPKDFQELNSRSEIVKKERDV